MGKFLMVVLAGVLAQVVGDELKAMLPRIAMGVLGLAVRMLPNEKAARYGEEWAAHLADIPGGLSKVFFAVDLIRAAVVLELGRGWRAFLAWGGSRLAPRLVGVVVVFYVALFRVRQIVLSFLSACGIRWAAELSKRGDQQAFVLGVGILIVCLVKCLSESGSAFPRQFPTNFPPASAA